MVSMLNSVLTKFSYNTAIIEITITLEELETAKYSNLFNEELKQHH